MDNKKIDSQTIDQEIAIRTQNTYALLCSAFEKFKNNHTSCDQVTREYVRAYHSFIDAVDISIDRYDVVPENSYTRDGFLTACRNLDLQKQYIQMKRNAVSEYDEKSCSVTLLEEFINMSDRNEFVTKLTEFVTKIRKRNNDDSDDEKSDYDDTDEWRLFNDNDMFLELLKVAKNMLNNTNENIHRIVQQSYDHRDILYNIINDVLLKQSDDYSNYDYSNYESSKKKNNNNLDKIDELAKCMRKIGNEVITMIMIKMLHSQKQNDHNIIKLLMRELKKMKKDVKVMINTKPYEKKQQSKFNKQHENIQNIISHDGFFPFGFKTEMLDTLVNFALKFNDSNNYYDCTLSGMLNEIKNTQNVGKFAHSHIKNDECKDEKSMIHQCNRNITNWERHVEVQAVVVNGCSDNIMMSIMARMKYQNQFGYATFNMTFLDTLRDFINKKELEILSVGCGKAYVEAAIQSVTKLDIHSTDIKIDNLRFMQVEEISANDAIEKYPDRCMLFMSWPDLETDDPERIKTMTDGKWVSEALDKFLQVHAGHDAYVTIIHEGRDMCIGGPLMYDILEEKFEEVIEYIELPNWHGIHTYATIYRTI